MAEECYWCGINLVKSQVTKDHFLSRPLYQHRHVFEAVTGQALAPGCLQTRSPACVSCAKCNSRRGAISAIFKNLQRLVAKNVIRHQKQHSKHHNNFMKAKKKIVSDLLHFHEKVKGIKNKDVRRLCLWEIEDILKYGIAHEEIQQRAYYLWEQAGYPEGRHEEFWFAAEKAVQRGL